MLRYRDLLLGSLSSLTLEGLQAQAMLSLKRAYWIVGSENLIGPPTSGTHVLDEFLRDALGGQRGLHRGRDAGYLVWNVTDGAVKRHAGAYSWQLTVGAGTSAKIGFHGATPTVQRANARPG